MDELERKRVVQYCAAMGWRYTGEDDSFAYRWSQAPFGVGDRRRARNVVRGTDHDVPFVAFDYQYDTETSDGRGHQVRTTHHFGILSIPLPTALPPLQVTPEDVIQRAAHAIGIGGGIDLESEDFNRSFTVHAHDPKFASDVLTPRTMEALLAAPPLAWRIEMADLVAWWEGALKPVELMATRRHPAAGRQPDPLVRLARQRSRRPVGRATGGRGRAGRRAAPAPATLAWPCGHPWRSPTTPATRQRRHRGSRMSSSGRRGARMPTTTGRSSARTMRRRRRSGSSSGRQQRVNAVVWVILGIVVLVLIGGVVSYNRFVRQKNLVQESWQQIDVELTRRHDLIPNLVETVKGYAAHERGTLEAVTAARAAASAPGSTPAAAGPAGERADRRAAPAVRGGRVLPGPQGQHQLPATCSGSSSETEDRIAAGRRFYNANVRALNTRVQAFPSSLIASVFGFKAAEYFEADDPNVRANPQVSSLARRRPCRTPYVTGTTDTATPAIRISSTWSAMTATCPSQYPSRMTPEPHSAPPTTE